MKSLFRKLFVFKIFTSLFLFECIALLGQTTLSVEDVRPAMQQLFTYHIDHKKMNMVILERSLKIYIDDFDPGKAYLLQQEVASYLEPAPTALNAMLAEYEKDRLSLYFSLNTQIQKAIGRAREWRQEWVSNPIHLVKAAEQQKDMSDPDDYFATRVDETKARHYKHFLRLISYQLEHVPSAKGGGKERQLVNLCEKQLRLIENSYLGMDDRGATKESEHLIVLKILKAMAHSLDAHTAYYSPEEALAMKVQLEKGMCGIGVVLQEGIEGVVVADIVDGGPAAQCGQIKKGDMIVEIDGHSIKEFSFSRVLEVLRGKEGSKVALGIFKSESKERNSVERVHLVRSKITLADKRVDVSSEPFGDGVIGKITLYSFYEGEDGICSEKDIKEAIQTLSKEGPLYGLVLDVRENTGGFLSQAIKVSGLFITNGVVVIAKYADGSVKYYRSVNGATAYDGPLVILISRGSASATEILAQTLQDYGVAVVVGDKQTYGKGTIQHQTVTNDQTQSFFKVTIGRYYTVSGKSTQIHGVSSDIVVPTLLSFEELGEGYLDYPLEPDTVAPAFVDSLSDIEPYTRRWFAKYYLPALQKPVSYWKEQIPLLKRNSEKRIKSSLNYQSFLTLLQEKIKEREKSKHGLDDLQMIEAVNIVRDMIFLQDQAKAL